MNCCSDCKHLWYEAPCQDDPYPQIGCAKGHWDGIRSQSNRALLDKETDCNDFEENIKNLLQERNR